MKCTEALLCGIGIGLVLAALIAGWIWVHLTRGWDHPLTEEEIKERVGAVWG